MPDNGRSVSRTDRALIAALTLAWILGAAIARHIRRHPDQYP